MAAVGDDLDWTKLDIQCKVCNCKMVVTQPRYTYGYGCKCKNCKRNIDKNDYIYHCSDGTTDKHPKGYDYCLKCSKLIVKMGTHGIYKEGWMLKRGTLNQCFQARYFQLSYNKKLFYFSAKPVDNSRQYLCGSVDFKKTPITKMGKLKNNEFDVITKERKWSFSCKDEKERNEWYNEIKLIWVTSKSTSNLN